MDDLALKARAVESAVFQSLINAMNNPEREDHWRKHADKLEQKFKTEHGHHYSWFIERKRNET